MTSNKQVDQAGQPINLINTWSILLTDLAKMYHKHDILSFITYCIHPYWLSNKAEILKSTLQLKHETGTQSWNRFLVF